jgi:hypothetical protein
MASLQALYYSLALNALRSRSMIPVVNDSVKDMYRLILQHWLVVHFCRHCKVAGSVTTGYTLEQQKTPAAGASAFTEHFITQYPA